MCKGTRTMLTLLVFALVSGVFSLQRRGGCQWPVNPAHRISSCSITSTGLFCEFFCAYGYKLYGRKTYVCQHNNPLPANTICIRVCDMPSPPLYGSVDCSQTETGMRCTFKCMAGYTLNGKSTYECTDNNSDSLGKVVCKR